MKRETDRDKSNSLDSELNRKIKVKTEGKTCLDSSAYTILQRQSGGNKLQSIDEVKNQSDLSTLEQVLIALEEMIDIVADCLTKGAD